MDWKDRMWIAMQEMKEACTEAKNDEGIWCIYCCPFGKYCKTLKSNPETNNTIADGLNW